jgi:hypothetical protein
MRPRAKSYRVDLSGENHVTRVQGDEVTMGYVPAKRAVSSPRCTGGDTHGRRNGAPSVSDGWLPETLHDVVSMMSAILLSGHQGLMR